MNPLPPDLLELATARLLAACAAERRAVCEELARQHPDFSEALLRLLRRIDGAERLLDHSFPPPPREEDPPDLGPYRVLRRLGEGAFGIVYLCEQQHPIARRIAVKVLRPGAGDPGTLIRFAAERQVLAALSHPSITPIHDAGHLPDGRPFFVMEFVDGLPIAAYCRSKDLDLEDSLRLFVQLCHGVEHAHGRGVVHRDLKPANVLVVDDGGRPQPKIIDFGIAKALAREPGSAPPTDVGRVLGTPGYMSPEQAAGRTDQVDARSDVFALGVMLYELLTGELPWRQRNLGSDDPPTDPPLPSQRITANAAGREGTAARRAAARVRGDLDWITAKAMARDRQRRYPTARELADDLERHLANRPVLAGPPSLAYRLRRFVRRHRTATLAVGAAALVVASALAVVLWQQRHSARAGQTEAVAVVDGLLRRANDAAVLQAPQNEAVRKALAADALAYYETWLRERPGDEKLRARRVDALLILAEVHRVLGDSLHASRIADEAALEAEALRAARDDVDAHARHALAVQQQVRALHLRQDYRGSLPLCELAVTRLQACAAARPAEFTQAFGKALLEHAHALAMTQQDKAGLEQTRRAVSALEDLRAHAMQNGELAGDLVLARLNVASQLMALKQFDEAEAELARCDVDLPAVVNERERLIATVSCQQAQVSLRRGDLPHALERFPRAIAASERWVQREPKQVRARIVLHEAVRQLAQAQEQSSAWTEASQSLAKAIAIAEAWVDAFPQDQQAMYQLRISLYLSARTLWNRFRRSDLAQAKTWLLRCEQLFERAAAAGAPLRPLLWEVHSVAAHVACADGTDADVTWERLAAELPHGRKLGEQEPAQQVAEAWIGVARHHFTRSAFAAAAEALDHAEPLLETAAVDDQLRSEAAWWRARIAARQPDQDATARHLATVVRLRGSWWGRWRTGDGEWDAWRLWAGTDAAAANAARERAAGHFRVVVDALAPRVAKTPDDPWLVVPWGLAAISLAIIEAERGDTAAARERVTAALTALQVVAEQAPRDLWDEARIAAGRALAERLAADAIK